MKKIWLIESLFIVMLYGNNECVYFIDKIGIYQNNQPKFVIKNRGLKSTEILIDKYEYKVFKDKFREDLKIYLDNLINIRNERYQAISILCNPLKVLEYTTNEKKILKIKQKFYRKMLFTLDKVYKSHKHKYKIKYVKGCEGYGNAVSRFISKYYESVNFYEQQRVHSAILKYNKCKKFEYEELRRERGRK